MLIRKIKDDELKRTREICYTAFEFNIDGEETPAKSAEMIRKNPQTRMKQQYLNTYGAFDEDNEMQACVSYCIASINFDGSIAHVAEVGDVASLPCSHGKGAVKGMFREILNDCYQSNVPFSYLYPFSGTYYNQFGYSYCVKNNIWKLSLDQLPNYRTTGTVVGYTPQRLSDVSEIYRQYTAGRNLSIVREDIEWHYAIGQFDPYRDHVFTYIYYDDTHNPLGYLTYSKQIDGKSNTIINCSAFCFVNRNGLLGLLDFLRSKKADYVYAQVSLPSDIDLTYIVPEHSLGAQRSSSAQQKPHGMVRVVHLHEALKLAKPVKSGTVSMNVTDKYLPQNNGKWELSWENGKFISIVQSANTETSKADITLDIALLSRLLCSGISSSQAALLPEGTFDCDIQLFCNLFPVKNVGIFEYF